MLYVTSIAVVAGCRINEIYSFEFFGKVCLVKGNVIELSYKPPYSRELRPNTYTKVMHDCTLQNYSE